MPSVYTTKNGEMVDLVCRHHYGRTREVTEKVLDANPGLAAMGPILPFATRIFLPDIAMRATRKPLVGLWD